MQRRTRSAAGTTSSTDPAPPAECLRRASAATEAVKRRSQRRRKPGDLDAGAGDTADGAGRQPVDVVEDLLLVGGEDVALRPRVRR